MFEFTFTLGPLRLHIRLANPTEGAGEEYVDLTGDYEQAADEYDYEPDDEVGFRGTRR